MMKPGVAVVVLGLVAGGAEAGPTARFGLTGAVSDSGAPGKTEIGPAVGLGLRGGPFVGEIEWAYLSFFDPDTTDGGIHRLGLSLRADLLRNENPSCLFLYGCTRAVSLWGEVGAGKRFGQWHLDASHISPADTSQYEAHVSIGVEFDNQVAPMRNGWQIGLRFAVAPRGYDAEFACRGSCATTTTGTSDLGNHGGYDSSVLVEWMFLFGD